MTMMCLQTWKRTSKPDVTVAVMMELNRRGTLKNALAGRDEQSVTVLLSFLNKYVDTTTSTQGK